VDKAGKRIEVLLEWRDVVVAAGHAVPTVADMMRIGASGEVRPEGVDLAAVEPWADTISHLLRQLKYGVPAPVAQIPDDLMQPALAPVPGRGVTMPPLSPTAGSTRGDDPVIAALRAWWHTEQKADPALRGLKEHHLRNIASTGSRTEAEIRRLLPAPLQGHARRIAEVIARALGMDAGPAPTTTTSSTTAANTTSSATAATGTAPSTDGATDGDTRPRSTSGGPSGAPAGSTTSTGPRPAETASPTAPPRADTAAPAAGLRGPDTRDGAAVRDVDPALAALDLRDAENPVGDDEVPGIRRRPGPQGTVLTWPKATVGQPTVLYRVVSVDEPYRPLAPQDADPVTVTEDVRHLDARPFTGPVRYVQVWVHAGRDREAAAAAEPVLHAEEIVVAQVTGVSIREDGRSIVGKWRVPPGVESVRVLRVPAERARREGHSSPEYRLKPLRPFVTGFVDDLAERGRRYVYELSVEVELDGPRVLSDPVKVEVEVSAVLAPVTNLRIVDKPDDPSVVDLRWTRPPGGEVRIYRTRVAPAAGVDARPIPVTALAQARLTDEADVGRPVDDHDDGTSTMADVPWLEGWTFAYLTPVTVLRDQAFVGRSQLAVHLGRVDDAKIVERTHRQILTFAWPRGADVVLAYLGGPRQDARDALRYRPAEEISRKQYEAQGGMYFRRPLAPRGCSVHLQPVAYSEGRRIHGPVTTLPYNGLRQLAYQVHVERDKAHQPTAVRVQIRSASEQGETYTFALVHHYDRFPLHERDGEVLAVHPVGDPRARPGYQFRPSGLWPDPGGVFWQTSVVGRHGYLRLFVCLPPELRSSVALFDPPIEQLYLAPPQGPR
jgi:hypothetical protein